jgi:hypothetical protein
MSGTVGPERRSRKTLSTPPRRGGLTDTDIARAQRAMPALGADWSLIRHEDYERDASLVIVTTSELEGISSFTLHAEAGEILAGVVTHDHYVRLGLHDRVEEAICAIAAVLDV